MASSLTPSAAALASVALPEEARVLILVMKERALSTKIHATLDKLSAAIETRNEKEHHFFKEFSCGKLLLIIAIAALAFLWTKSEFLALGTVAASTLVVHAINKLPTSSCSSTPGA